MHSRSRSQYDEIPLRDLPNGPEKIEKEKQRIHNYALSSTTLFVIILAAAAALCLRIDVQRRLLLSSECSTRSVQPWLPFLIALYDAIRFQREQHLSRPREDDLDATAYDELQQALKSAFLSSRWRYVPTAFLLSLGCYMVAGLWLASESSHVCPLLSSDITLVPRLQILALCLDTFLAIAVLELALGGMLPSSPLLATPMSWAVVLTLASSVWAIIAMVCYVRPESHAWLLLKEEQSPVKILFSMFCQALLLTVLCVSSLYSVSVRCLPLQQGADSETGHECRAFTYSQRADSSVNHDSRPPLHLVRKTSLSANIISFPHLVFRAHLLRVVDVQPNTKGYSLH